MRERLERELDRRMLLRLGAAAGLGAAAMPRLAQAAASSDHMPRVRALVARWTGPGLFPGLVATLGLPGREPEVAARGTQGFGDRDAMDLDTLFRIYSMTKPITGMAAMQLVAEGKLGLDQPLHEILPEWRDMKVQDTYDGSVTALHDAPRPITIRHLVTHTSGIAYVIVQQGPIRDLLIQRHLVTGQISRIAVPGLTRGQAIEGLDNFARELARVPLVCDPGTRWSYSMGLDVMGRVIEVVSGRRFADYLAETIFGPCGMTSTWFQVPGSEAHRLATSYGVLGPLWLPIDRGGDSIFLDKPPFAMGGAGLVSSPRDYDRFLRMLAEGGTLGGRRVLAAEAVRMGTSNLLPAGVKGPAFFSPPSQFGAGGRVGIGAEAGVYGWAGAAGTLATVDMKTGIRAQLYAQFMPPTANSLLSDYRTALNADLSALTKGV